VDGVPLKVGIADDLRARLLQHRASRQSALKLKPGGDRSRPGDLESKGSVLAKHLYYDETVAPNHDLKTEVGRRAFLETGCVVRVEPTCTRQEARVLEKQREAAGVFRYVGRVRIRGRVMPESRTHLL
jgi:hypothetical protein